jgi:hypothetical protein
MPLVAAAKLVAEAAVAAELYTVVMYKVQAQYYQSLLVVAVPEDLIHHRQLLQVLEEMVQIVH